MSFVNEVNGIGAQITLSPCRCIGRITLLQQDPSAHAPCTKTIDEFCGNALISQACFLRCGSQCRLPEGTLSSRRQFQRRASLARNVRSQGTAPSRWVSPSEKLRLPRERRKDRSCPRSRAGVVWTYENIPGISGRALRSTRSPETNRVESLCSRAVRAEPCPMCMTQAEHFPDSLRRRCTASAFRPLSKWFGGGCPYFLPWEIGRASCRERV